VQTIRGWVREACAFARKEKQTRWVIKPYESDSSATTYVADGVDDLIDRLRDLEEEEQIPRGSPFILQEVIEGEELSTEVWFQNGEIVPGSWNNTIELKKFYPGDLGPTVGSSTSTVWFLREPSRAIQQTFGQKKFQEWARSPIDHKGRRHRPYHGPLDFNSIIRDGRMYFLEATPRPGWMTYYATMQLLPPDELGDLMVRIAQSRLDKLPAGTGEFAYELTLSTPPYPTTEHVPIAKDLGREYRGILDEATGVKISGPVTDPRINWVDVRINQKTGQLEQAGTFGQIASIAMHGKDLKKVSTEVHRLFEQIKVPEKMGRIVDGADRALAEIPKLRQMGFETP
jgi:phosphoribosylamine-glycine ligase